MEIHHYREPSLFLQRARPFLRAEAENNLFLGMRERRGATSIVLGEESYLATLEQAEEVVGCAVRTPPYGLVISRAEAGALDPLIDDLASKHPTLPSLLGPEPTASAFAGRWSERMGTRIRSLMRMRLFEARQAQLPERPAEGVLRTADHSDLPTVTAWAVAFHHEARTNFPLEGIAFCCINADVTNPTTNKIYPPLGYRPVCDTSNIDLNAR